MIGTVWPFACSRSNSGSEDLKRVYTTGGLGGEELKVVRFNRDVVADNNNYVFFFLSFFSF